MSTDSNALLEFLDVGRVYQGKGRRNSRVDVVALDQVSLAIRRGEFVGTLGPSGGGKSTFLNLAGALDRPTQGKILFAGVQLTTSTAYAYRRNQVGFIFQNYHLLQNRTARDNVALGMMLTGHSRQRALSEADYWLRRLGLEHRASHYPSMLSGGECQRVAIARAMVKRPPLLLADEPTGNLDAASRHEVLEAISGLNREMGTTVIMVTHTPAEAKSYCTRLVTIDRTLQQIVEPSPSTT